MWVSGGVVQYVTSVSVEVLGRYLRLVLGVQWGREVTCLHVYVLVSFRRALMLEYLGILLPLFLLFVLWTFRVWI